jgi:phosphoenolpyruvate synthase/pyruvate phosphate dikinase
MKAPTYTKDFGEISLADIGQVGGKNASLGELFNSLKPKGVNVLDGFATTADAFQRFVEQNELQPILRKFFADLNTDDGAVAKTRFGSAKHNPKCSDTQRSAGRLPRGVRATLRAARL